LNIDWIAAVEGNSYCSIEEEEEAELVDIELALACTKTA
jgi:hypothetical protein